MKNIIAFVLGGTVGSLITWKLLEKKYKEIADEEIEAIREYYKGKEKLADFGNEENVTVEHSELKEEKTNYNKLVTDLGYADDATIIVNHGEDTVAPYIIAPEEYGDLPGYDAEEWTYYSDGILANDDFEIIADVQSIIGDGLNHFGEYEDDSVYIRNENVKCDYQILKHDKTFEEISAGME